MKILVSGNAGAGKTSLAKRLAEIHGLPIFGLDKIVWKEGWVKTPQEERDKKISEILSKESWILEGITKNGLKEADIIYFIDINPIRCSLNVIRRFLKNGLGSRPELPENCPEYIGFLKALKTNYIFHKVTKPWLLDESLRKPGSKFVHIQNYNDIEKLISTKEHSN